MKRLDITGRRFNFLVAVRFDHKDKKRNACWLFKCDCGKEHIAQAQHVKKGVTRSCGCYRDKKQHENIIHGFARKKKQDRFYIIWSAMKGRCLTPTCSNYSYYGGKGIKVCEKWMKFLNFKEDMYEDYQKHFEEHNGDTSIDRINPSGNYEKDNCRWATGKVQANNKKKNWC